MKTKSYNSVSTFSYTFPNYIVIEVFNRAACRTKLYFFWWRCSFLFVNLSFVKWMSFRFFWFHLINSFWLFSFTLGLSLIST